MMTSFLVAKTKINESCDGDYFSLTILVSVDEEWFLVIHCDDGRYDDQSDCFKIEEAEALELLAPHITEVRKRIQSLQKELDDIERLMAP